ncbi:hypothetical protein TC_0304 [Chlamydia muridarum str. Nigg]|uniref:Uncharacterized protein n=1 Tax=Chlamydia muridarum (strain MoPn / Nigg) TaxID=243161 RepID=Q9PL04_CHLMU|nr:hypothetical protein TC_0304 [Chlamydia muridarum str. Nigg]AHH22695.1 hypothetical protein TAC_01590 [Chlamydia muridarum str. Nigg3 CMUT3-5]AHH23619.1 hypothetical protein Y015_01590 [Chlamydia muridarum str. Nigg CM972]
MVESLPLLFSLLQGAHSPNGLIKEQLYSHKDFS